MGFNSGFKGLSATMDLDFYYYLSLFPPFSFLCTISILFYLVYPFFTWCSSFCYVLHYTVVICVDILRFCILSTWPLQVSLRYFINLTANFV